ncbi:hypothetical protein [Mucilaginibacter celer]|uniref:Uncharacterized protein n=1 Tax=Mucilaginibacter celer TaxID=2305508 RepID=A0A494W2V3_9SPHI|nr:hypothetical protein [Mucilaginibacter celer]AYL97622.1 hypothetical protein HYN43_021020 [Mucilaginibacter celer]
MIWFLLKKRWTNFFSITNNVYELLMQLMYLVVMVSVATTAGYIYTLTVNGQLKLQPVTLIRFLMYSLYLLPVLFKFFPSVRVKPALIQKYYPLTLFKAATTELVYAVFSTSSVFFVALFCILFISVSGAGSAVFVALFLFGICGIVLAENILAAYYLKRKLFLAVLIVYILVGTPAIGYLSLSSISYLLPGAMVLLCGLFYLFYTPNELLIERPVMFFASSHNMILKIMSRVTKFRVAVAFSFVIQTALSVLFITVLFDELQFLKFYMLSSLMYFSYCYNNTFGFFAAPTFNMIMAGCTMGQFIRFYLKALIPLFILNLVSFGLIFFFQKTVFTVPLISGLVVLLLFSMANGLLFSIIKIKNVEKAVSFDQNNFNTNLLPTYILGAAGVITGLTEDKPILFYAVLGLLVVYSVAVVIYLFIRQHHLLHILANRLASKKR